MIGFDGLRVLGWRAEVGLRCDFFWVENCVPIDVGRHARPHGFELQQSLVKRNGDRAFGGGNLRERAGSYGAAFIFSAEAGAATPIDVLRQAIQFIQGAAIGNTAIAQVGQRHNAVGGIIKHNAQMG